MAKNKDVTFKSSSIKIPQLSSSPRANLPFCSLTLNSPSIRIPRRSSCPLSDLPLCSQNLNSSLLQAKLSFTNFIHSLKLPPLRFPSTSPPLGLTQNLPGLSAVTRARKEVDKRVFVRNKDGNELERKGMEFEVLDAEFLSGGMLLLRLQVPPAKVYDPKQAEINERIVSNMGITKKVSISAQPARDTGDVDLAMNVVERGSRGWSGSVEFANGIVDGLLSGLKGWLAYSYSNRFGKNQKLKISHERGLFGSSYRVNHRVLGIEGDDKRIQSSIMIQKSRTRGNLVHDEQCDNSSLTIGRLTSVIEFSKRLLSPKITGTAGLKFQCIDARDEQGKSVTASGNTHDDMLLAKGGFVYTDNLRSSMFSLTMEQGLPILPGFLSFNRVTARATKSVELGLAKLHLSLSGRNVLGNFPPHEAFPLGGTNSVRGYEEGAIGSGRSYVVGSGEFSVPLNQIVDGVLFVDYGSGIGSGAMQETRRGYGYGSGFRVKTPLGVLRFEFALNDKGVPKLHFCVGNPN